jgi:hypothetical protein
MPVSLRRRRPYRSARAIAFCASVAFLADVSAAQQRPTLGESLTDRELWRIFSTMSEDGGTFPSENFVSNEKAYQYVIPTLQRTLTPAGVYLGVGPEQNFTYIVNLKPRLAIIFDIRRQNAMTHLMYKALFELSPSRADFVARLFSRPLSSPVASSATPAEIFSALSSVAASDSAFAANWKAIVGQLTSVHHFPLSETDLRTMRHVFEAFREAGPNISYSYRLGAPPASTEWLVTFAQLQSLANAEGVNMAFLATEENYRWLRAFQMRNLVVPVVADFAGPKAIRAVGEYLKGRDAVVTAFYTSNVEQYLFNGYGGDQRFYRNVAALPLDSTSTFIRSLPAGSAIRSAVTALPYATNGVARIVDSGGVRVITLSGTDSSGKPTTTRTVLSLPAITVNAVGAFVSGTAPMSVILDAFTKGELTTYQRVITLTKTEGWK